MNGCEEMEKQFELLLILHEKDQALASLNEESQSIPLELQKLESDFLQQKEKCDHKIAEIAEYEKKKRSYELDLASSEDKIKHTEMKLNAVKTNKEYQAGMKEIETMRHRNTVLEEQIFELMEKIETAQSSLTYEQNHFKNVQVRFEQHHLALEERLQILDGEKSKVFSEREALAGQLDASVFQKYLRIQKSGILPAITYTKNGQCESCFMNIPHQLYNEVLQCKALMTCPSCQRILLRKIQTA